MLTLVRADHARAMLFRACAMISAGLTILAPFSADGWKLATLCVAVNGMFFLLNRDERYQRLPGAILLSFQNVLYFQFPLFYVCAVGQAYEFDFAFVVPGSNEKYLAALVPAVMFYSLCLLALLAGVLAGSRWRAGAEYEPREPRLNRIGLAGLLAFGLCVIWIQMGDIQSIFSARSAQTEKAESLMALLFNDKSFQLVFPVLFYLFPLDFKARSTKSIFLFIIGLFLFLNVYSTSKGAVLTIATSFFLYPVVMYGHQQRRIYWPTKLVLVSAVALTIPLYFLALVGRVSKATGQTLSAEVTMQAVSEGLSGRDAVGKGALDLVAMRLSANVTNLVLIYGEFAAGNNEARAQQFRQYVGLSFLNLVLPGTPYPKAYVPSSNLLPDVLAHAPLESRLDKTSYLSSANTQPYTIVGFLLIAIGSLPTVLGLWAMGLLFALAHQASRSVTGRLLVIFTFMVMFTSYGFEVAGQYALMTIVTSYFLIVVVHGATAVGSAAAVSYRTQPSGG